MAAPPSGALGAFLKKKQGGKKKFATLSTKSIAAKGNIVQTNQELDAKKKALDVRESDGLEGSWVKSEQKKKIQDAKRHKFEAYEKIRRLEPFVEKLRTATSNGLSSVSVQQSSRTREICVPYERGNES